MSKSIQDEELLKKAKSYYDTWRKQITHCPAFEGEVIVISLKGWNHITGATGSKKRSLKDVKRRLMLLPYAKQIIERSNTIQNITTKGGLSFYALEAMVKVADTKPPKYKKVRVILVEDRAGNKIFYSVMDKKQTLTSNKKGTPHA